MCIFYFVVINLVLLFVAVGVAVFVVGAPVLTCYVYTRILITILRYLFDLKATRQAIKVISIMGSILVYYIYHTPLNICMSFAGTDKKKILTFYLSVWFGIVGVFGGGFPVTVALLLFLRVNLAIKINSYGGGKEGGNDILLSESTNIAKTQPDKVKKRPRDDNKENTCTGSAGSQPPCKRGRKSKLDSEHRCGECTVWLQTDSNRELLKYHKGESNMRHPFERLIEFNNFLSCNGVYKISLRTDSCLCNACYRDCVRGIGKPRWLGLSKHLICRHCILCCNGPSVCTCDSVLEWGPEQWYGTIDELKMWIDYYQCSNVVDDQQTYNLCKSHYVSMRQAASNRSCKICSSTSPSQ